MDIGYCGTIRYLCHENHQMINKCQNFSKVYYLIIRSLIESNYKTSPSWRRIKLKENISYINSQM